MQEFTIDTGAWASFWNKWQDTINAIPGMKEEILERAGKEIQAEVHRAIDASGLDDRRFGRVKKWQNPHVGSGLGYVAVRSDSVMVRSGGGTKEPLNAGALTNFLTSGHKVRKPSGRAKLYRSRATKTRVEGFRFYKTAGAQAEKAAAAAAEAFLARLEEELST